MQAAKAEFFFELFFQPTARTHDMKALNRGTFGADDVIVMLFSRQGEGEKWGFFPHGDPPDQPDLLQAHEKPENRARVAEFL